ncbi:MAG: hypothetical protein FJY85_23595 [Deltaproteobacteria bacterium]|nr:hypothetical protein [Deltaproteobacteria bacterium]
MNGRQVRLSGLFHEEENAVIVAMDHGRTFGHIHGRSTRLFDPCFIYCKDITLPEPGGSPE